MIPMAFAYLMYWRASNNQLLRWGYSKYTIANLGMFAALALLVYTLVLGAVGDNFQLSRRIGIIFFFTFTYLNQLLIIYRLYKHEIEDPTESLRLMLNSVLG